MKNRLPKIHIIIFFILCFLASDKGYGQNRIEGGFFLGTSYYNGDLNPQSQFYRVQPSFGVLMRVALNHRLAFKGGLTAVEIEGGYPRQNLMYPPVSGNQPRQYNFGRTIADLTTQLEINFFEYDNPFREDETSFSPYIALGLGYSIYQRYFKDQDNNSEKPQFILSLPIGIGVKWKPADWVHVGLEWTFRKTFVDDLDAMGSGGIDPADPYGFEVSSTWHNNDWYSFAGAFVAFDLFHKKIPCNAGY